MAKQLPTHFQKKRKTNNALFVCYIRISDQQEHSHYMNIQRMLHRDKQFMQSSPI